MQDITDCVYTFENMREGNFLYVDKTEYIWKMVSPARGIYFLSRPRRFGKSLTLTTLKALFEGKRELFKGLAIDSKPYDWKAYPVIHLNLLTCCAHTAEGLRTFLKIQLENVVEEFELDVAIDENQLAASFSRIIRELYKQHGPVVILIDEYDKPLLENLTNGKVREIREALAEFYSTLKAEEPREHFVFLTGVTKFCQVSIFSKLNNLHDITMEAEYATMLGYTQEELEVNFGERLANIERRQALSHEAFMAKVKEWYDGFRFEESAESVYNPVSIASFIRKNGKFSNYWFETGTPTFLMDVIKQNHFDFEEVLKKPVDEIAFSAYDVEHIDLLTLLMQTGYLTIAGTIMKRGECKYLLDFPNFEVKKAFEVYLLGAYSNIGRTALNMLLDKMLDYLEESQTGVFIDALQTFFANIPYDIQLKDEKYYQSVIYVLFMALGTKIQAEARTNQGRIDAAVEFDNIVYVMEFKIDKPAQEAMEQIEDREYYQRYRHCGKAIHLLGISFSTAKRQVAEWLEKIEH